MKKSRYSEEEIATALTQADSGTSLEEITRKMGISEATFYRWKDKYAGMGIAEVRRFAATGGRKSKAEAVVADLSLDKVMLQDVLRKKL
jgi:putative transposase